MALEKKSGFSFDVESKFKDKIITGDNDKKGTEIAAQDYEYIPEDNREEKDAPKYVHIDVMMPEQKERKARKVSFLTYESLDDRLTAYAKKIGVKKVAIFEAAMTAYLDIVDPVDPKK